MKLLVMLLLSTVCFSQIKVKKTYVIYEKDTLKIVDKELLYTDTILYLENGSSIRISKNLLYYYSPQVYLKFKFDKKTNKYLKL
jgi:Tfp pilus assembly protein PilZ